MDGVVAVVAKTQPSRLATLVSMIGHSLGTHTLKVQVALAHVKALLKYWGRERNDFFR